MSGDAPHNRQPTVAIKSEMKRGGSSEPGSDGASAKRPRTDDALADSSTKQLANGGSAPPGGAIGPNRPNSADRSKSTENNESRGWGGTGDDSSNGGGYGGSGYNRGGWGNNRGGFGGGGGGYDRDYNVDRKIFVGGLNWDAVDSDLSDYFRKYGDVKHVQVKFDPITRRSRGFAFVEFFNPQAAQEALKTRNHEIKGKDVEVKKATTRENKKIFVGGVAGDLTEEEIKKYFEQFGPVEEVELPMDKTTQRRRNFAFIVYNNEAGADKCVEQTKHLLGDRWCDVKKATPMKPHLMNQEAWQQPGGWGNNSYGGGQAVQAPNMSSPAQAPAAAAAPQGADPNAAGYNPYDYYNMWWQYYYGNYANMYGGQGQQPQPTQGQAPAAATGGYDWSQYYAAMAQQQQQQQQQPQAYPPQAGAGGYPAQPAVGGYPPQAGAYAGVQPAVGGYAPQAAAYAAWPNAGHQQAGYPGQ